MVNITELKSVKTQKKLSEVFPELPKERSKENASVGVNAWQTPEGDFVKHPLTKAPDASFCLQDMDAFRTCYIYLNSNRMGRGLWISGPTGAGKSDFIRFMLSSLNLPYLELNGSKDTERKHLVGSFAFKPEKGTYFQLGILPKAMMYGIPLIIHEADLIHTEEFVALNKVLESGTLEIEENGGQIIEPKPGFRLIVTANTGGSGDPDGNYVRREMDASILSRFDKMEYGYPSKALELKILKHRFSNLEDSVLNLFIDFAHKMRVNGQGILPFPISTRSLIAMCQWVQDYAPISTFDTQALKGINLTLNTVLTAGLPFEQKIALYSMFNDVVGHKGAVTFAELWSFNPKEPEKHIPHVV